MRFAAYLPQSDGTQGQQTPALVAFRVTEADQWIDTTTGRIAPEAYSWMQAVHWIAGCGLYDQEPGHGPKWGPTTVAIAQEIAALTECRPSIDYLARKLGVSERTVQYHLAHLRAAGLLVYRSKGTRLAGRVRLASVYERVIPAQFDQALGIRTVLRDETAPPTRGPQSGSPRRAAASSETSPARPPARSGRSGQSRVCISLWTARRVAPQWRVVPLRLLLRLVLIPLRASSQAGRASRTPRGGAGRRPVGGRRRAAAS